MNLEPIATDFYESPAKRKALFPRLGFYSRLIGIVISEGKKATKGYTGDDWASASLRVLQALEHVGVHFSIHGLEHINALTSPAVFIANHMSTMETLVLPLCIQPRKEVTFVTKESLLSYPIFKHVLASRDPVTVARSSPRDDLKTVLEEGCKRLEAGRSIIVFPQSTRSATIDPQKFNSIGVKLAKRANVPVIPVALKTDAWGTGGIIKELGPISPHVPVNIRFGAAQTVEGNGKETQQNILTFITSYLNAWKNNLPQQPADLALLK